MPNPLIPFDLVFFFIALSQLTRKYEVTIGSAVGAVSGQQKAIDRMGLRSILELLPSINRQCLELLMAHLKMVLSFLSLLELFV